MKKIVCHLVSAFIAGNNLFSQENSVLSNGVLPNGAFGGDTQIGGKKVIAQPYLREADVMWSKRIWRIIDVREKMNQALYYPLQPLLERKSLFDVLKQGIFDHSLVAYANPLFDDEFKEPMMLAEVERLLTKVDSTHFVEEITSENIRQYLIKEDWFFDKQRSVMDVRIIGICPLVEDFAENGDFRGYKRLFWIYFPEARKVLVNYRAFTRGNHSALMTFDAVFSKRMFSSAIVKESNVFDRSILDYKKGIEILLEGEKIKNDMMDWESDLWHY